MVRALVELAKLPVGVYSGASAIADDIDAPRNYLGKLLQQLSRQGLVVSQKGMGGGFRLARPAAKISLYEVVEPIDHVSRWSGCMLGHKFCENEKTCIVHDQWKLVSDAYLDLLRQTSIADLAGR